MTGFSSASSPEASPAAREIRAHLEDPQAHFVFPSEITARFWLRHCLESTTRRGLRTDRFLDWGDFKRGFLRYRPDARAVNRAGRTLFAWRLLEDNRRQSFLRALVPQEHADSPQVFLTSIARILPGLARLPALSPRWPEASADKRDDLLRLYREYRSFLEAFSLYEPLYENPRLEAGERRILVFFPEVIEDFQEYGSLVAGHRSAATVAIPPLPSSQRSFITVHDNLNLELERVLGEVETLLDRGIDPEDIVLSVTDLEHLEPALARQAELRGVPLQIHRSRPVTSFPTGRLFAHIREAVGSRFSLETLKELLLNRALPWRRPVMAEGLVRLGLDNRLLRSLPADKGDAWEQAFRRTRAIGNPRGLALPELQKFYRSLRRRLSEIHAADSFRGLKERLTAFARELLDTSRWQATELGAFQFALDKLDDLQEVAAGDVPAFELWLSYLGDELYLPKKRAGGVPTYDYPVAEGIFPAYHFLVNASQDGTGRRLKPLAALNPYEEESLGLPERDLGPDHLRLYVHSGRRAALSYSRRGLSRSHLPPALFVTRGTVLEWPEPTGQPDGPELQERLAWTKGQAFRPSRLQQQGFGYASATALAARGVDAAATPLPGQELAAALVQRLVGRHPERGACLGISPTALERFRGCPFAYLLETVLGVVQEEYTVVTSDPRELGAIMHRSFESFFRTLQEEAPGQEVSLEPSRRERYRTLMREAVEGACAGWARRHPLPFAPLWLELQDRARELALAFLEVELEHMSGERVTEVELRLEAPFAPDPGVLLVGTIDRVSDGPEGLTIVDYKKKGVPTARQIFAQDASSFQMPFYLYLLRAHGRRPRRAAYYSIEERRYRFVIGGPREATVAPEQLEDTLRSLEEGIAEMAGRLRRGDFAIRRGAAPACRLCNYSEICRRRYLLGRAP